LGYTLDYLWLREPDMNVARFQQILDHRRIHGLVLAPLDDPREDYELDWSRFVAVAIGLSLGRPRLPRVLHDNYRAMLAVLAELEALGVRRVGLCLAAESDERTLGMWTGAYLATGRRRPGWCAPPLIAPGFNARDFSAWRRAERVEAVISVHPVLPLLQAVLRKTRVKLVSLNLNGADETTPGIYQEPRILGAAAVERVVDLLHRGGRSAAVERADELLHLGRWRPGA
ncbi:MAG: hypothetical protein H7Y06_14630, partial [Opitutaceae bacterium]|nr:hypothetical protein [Opitutaceae bacterium]